MLEEAKRKTHLRFPLWLKTLIVLILSVFTVGIVSATFFASSVRTITRNHYVEHSIEVADTLGLYLNLDHIKVIKNKVDEIYKSIPDNEKVENSHWDEPEWKAYLDNYNEVLNMPEYKSLLEQIKLFHSKNDARYTYLAYADLDGKKLVYLVDDSPEEEWCRPGSFDDFTESDMSIYDHLEEGFTPEITNMPEYGYLVSVGRPIFDENHEIVAFSLVDLSMDAIATKEMENTQTLIIILVCLSVGMVAVGFLLVTFLIIRPIRTLTKAANEYSEEGNNGFNKFEKININTRDEIEDLSNSMKKMESDIKRYVGEVLSTTSKLESAEKKADEMKYYADRDALTGTMNKRAYFELEVKLNKEIENKKAKFSVTMIDLNDLKITNDTLGHEKGDALIVEISDIIKKLFAKSEIFRIGGDEFVVISEGDDLKNIRKLEESFKKQMADVNIDVSAAIGVAIYDETTDNNVEDTFKRADERMYVNKKVMKEQK